MFEKFNKRSKTKWPNESMDTTDTIDVILLVIQTRVLKYVKIYDVILKCRLPHN